jgi:5-methylcytosine-specific restriction protein B
MSRLKNLYTHLITNRRAEVDGWLQHYTKFSTDVSKISAALHRGAGIQDAAAYEGTSFSTEKDPWLAFARQLLFAKSNGISSRGQSVLSDENFGRFIRENDFVSSLAELVKSPTKANFVMFESSWESTREKHGAKRNPLLTNRTLAACTRDVTTTTNNAYFESVYRWLVGEGIIEQNANPAADWYDKNIQLMTFLRETFAVEISKGETTDYLLSIFVWCLYENISNPFTLKKQVIKYGAPGTGKTHTAKQNTRLLFAIWREKYQSLDPQLTHEFCSEVVQFHPSYGYEDFIEGLRPVLTPDGRSQVSVQLGRGDWRRASG